MDDIKDRLLWRADNAGDGFYSDMIYRDAFRCIEAQDKRIEALEAALRKGQYMRQRQKQYFKDRTQDNLVGSKQAEAAFDRALAGEKKDG